MEVKAGPGKGTVYAVLSGEKEAAHGLAPSLWIYDELGIDPTGSFSTRCRQHPASEIVASASPYLLKLLMTGTPSPN